MKNGVFNFFSLVFFVFLEYRRGYESEAVGRCTHWGEGLAGWSFMAPRLIPVEYAQMVGLDYMTTQCAYRIPDPEPRGAGN